MFVENKILRFFGPSEETKGQEKRKGKKTEKRCNTKSSQGISISITFSKCNDGAKGNFEVLIQLKERQVCMKEKKNGHERKGKKRKEKKVQIATVKMGNHQTDLSALLSETSWYAF